MIYMFKNMREIPLSDIAFSLQFLDFLDGIRA